MNTNQTARIARPATPVAHVAMLVLTLAACRDDPTQIVSDRPPPPARWLLGPVAGDEQRGEVATVLPQPVVLRLSDNAGRPVAGQRVYFNGDGTIVEDSVRTDSAGQVSVHWRLAEVAVKQYMRAGAAGVAGVSSTLVLTATGIAGPPVRLVAVTGSDTAVALPLTLLDPVLATGSDRYGNPTPIGAASWKVVSGGGNVLRTGADTAGRAQADWQLGAAEGPNELEVTLDSLTVRITAWASVPFAVAAIAPGVNHTCALTSDGTAYCWGAAFAGQLGPGSVRGRPRKSPVRVRLGDPLRAVVAGAVHSCALLASGATRCWGWIFSSDQDIGGSVGVRLVSLTAGASHTCGLDADGKAYCWGSNEWGQLGNPDVIGTTTMPIPVASPTPFVSLSAGTDHTCGVTRFGDTFCWGLNDAGQLGRPTQDRCYYTDFDYYYYPTSVSCSRSPATVSTPSELVSVESGGAGSCGLGRDGTAWCWGNESPQPFALPRAMGLTSLAVSNGQACGLDSIGAVSCWSLYEREPWVSPPRPLDSTIPFTTLRAGYASLCGVARAPAGVAYCWGDNNSGQLGDGTTAHRWQPTPVVAPLVR